MSLTPEIESLLSKVTDATKREGLRKQFEDPSLGDFNKELSASVLRQADYSRKMNELTEMEKTKLAAYDKGLSWVEGNRANYSEAIKQRDAAITRAAEFELKAASLAKNPAANTEFNLNMSDEAQVAQAIKEARQEASAARQDAATLADSVTKIKKMLDDGELLTAAQFEQEAGKRLEAFSRATMDVMGTIAKGKSEFGVDIERDALLNEAARYGGDLGKAYESVTAGARLEKIKTDIRNEVTKELEAKYANSAGNPLASGAPPMMGPLQAMVFAQKNPESTIDPSIPADGSGRLAHAIAAELRAEGKF
jgi:small-conductance mechanosensitive channel